MYAFGTYFAWVSPSKTFLSSAILKNMEEREKEERERGREGGWLQLWHRKEGPAEWNAEKIPSILPSFHSWASVSEKRSSKREKKKGRKEGTSLHRPNRHTARGRRSRTLELPDSWGNGPSHDVSEVRTDRWRTRDMKKMII